MSNSGKTKKKRCHNGLRQCKEIGNDCYSLEFINNCKTRKKNKEIKHLKECSEIVNQPELNITHNKVDDDQNKDAEPVNYDCLQLETLKNASDIAKKNYNELKQKCDSIKYKTNVSKENTLFDLLKWVSNTDYKTLISQFPDAGSSGKYPFTKSHIFEGLWKIIFLLEMDDFYNGYKREFHLKLEGHKKVVDPYDYLNTPINSGNLTGIADLYFTLIKPVNNNIPATQNNTACLDNYSPTVGDAILFTSKYYKNEKGAGDYDIEKIALEAFEKNFAKTDSTNENGRARFTIIPLVNDKDTFITNIQKSQKAASGYINTKYVYGSSDFEGDGTTNGNYYLKLQKWIKDNNIFENDNIKKSLEKIKEKISTKQIGKKLNLRFHQRYFVDYTCNKIKLGTTQFVWGAVARSGKSFMVGGLISKIKPKNVVLILGAISETKNQFINELFLEFDGDFGDYEINDYQLENNKGIYNKGNPNKIFVISQEQLKHNTGSADAKKIIKELLTSDNKPLIFFDEIHQGAGKGEESLQETLIDELLGYNKNTCFVMVTATYGKPILRYGVKNKTDVVYWSYDMIVNKMKNFKFTMVNKDADDEHKLIQSSELDYDTKMNILKTIVDDYKSIGATEESIANEYNNNPKLTYLIPMVDTINYIDDNDKDLRAKFTNNVNIINLFERTGDKNSNLKYKQSFQNYLKRYIYDHVYNELLYKKYNYVANGGGNYHTQLWFLPTMLRNKTKSNKETSETEDNSVVAPMCLAVAKAIVDTPEFNNFNILIVHSGNNAYSNDIQEKQKERIKMQCIKDDDIKTCVTKHEIEAKQNNKSLIILTGKRLRVGISLPCADVAIHMDPIRSYDILYQTMFRVLTDRPNKERGFFIDTILDRGVEFMYDYAINIKKQHYNKQLLDDKITINDVKDTLLLFDVNMLQSKFNYKENLKLIEFNKKIIDAFYLNNDLEFQGYRNKYYMEATVKEIKYNLQHNLDTISQTQLKQIMKNLKIVKTSGNQGKSKKISNKIGDGIKIKTQTNTDVKDDKLNDTDDDSALILYDELAFQIKHIVTGILLFDETTTKDNIMQKFNDINDNLDKIAACDEKYTHFCNMVLSYLYGEPYLVGDCVGISERVEQNGGTKCNIGNIKKTNDTMVTTGKILKKNISNGQITYDIEINNGIVIENVSENKLTHINNANPIQKLENIENNPNEHRNLKTIIDYNKELLDLFIANDTNRVMDNLLRDIKDELNNMPKRIINERDKFIDNAENSKFCPENFIQSENVMNLIRSRLQVREQEKNLFGEVFTPLELVCEMLSRLPEDVWRNPDLKWLDPANGIGNFPIVVYYKLMQTLVSIPEKKKRSKHIIENMLYMNELNPVNVNVSKKIFKWIDPDAHPNIRKGDFLDIKLKHIDGVDKFDIIIGNPPFNPPKTETGSSGNSIWQNFVMKSFYMINNTGYLCFVHPPGWKKPTDEIFNENKYLETNDFSKQIRQGQVWQVLRNNGAFTFIYTNDQNTRSLTNDYWQHFPAVDYYVYQKGADKNTLCSTKNVFMGQIIENSNIKLNYNLNYLPNLITKETQEILKKITETEGNNPKFEISREHLPLSNSGIYKYIYTFNKNNEPLYQYSNKIIDNINVDKVVMNSLGGINNYSILYVKSEDKIGSHHESMYSVANTKKISKYLINTFSSNIIKFVFAITQYASGKRQRNEPLVANSISVPDKIIIDYYEYYDIVKYKPFIDNIIKLFETTNNKTEKNNSGGQKYTHKTNRKIHNRSYKITTTNANKKTRKTH